MNGSTGSVRRHAALTRVGEEIEDFETQEFLWRIEVRKHRDMVVSAQGKVARCAAVRQPYSVGEFKPVYVEHRIVKLGSHDECRHVIAGSIGHR